jgi:1,3-beta-glucanosyltransferase GAS1
VSNVLDDPANENIPGILYKPGLVADALSDGDQCEIDVPLLKSLGINTIAITQTDPTQDHDRCMQLLAENGIYVFLPLVDSRNIYVCESCASPGNVCSNFLCLSRASIPIPLRCTPTYLLFLRLLPDMTTCWQSQFRVVTCILVSAARDLTTFNSKTGLDDIAFKLAKPIKAAARDIKALRDAHGYRPIPVGYTSDRYAYDPSRTSFEQTADWMVCSDVTAETVDFLAVSSYEAYCGDDASYSESGYANATAYLRNYPAPFFFVDQSCLQDADGLWSGVRAVFGSDMVTRWSGTIVSEWSEE